MRKLEINKLGGTYSRNDSPSTEQKAIGIKIIDGDFLSSVKE